MEEQRVLGGRYLLKDKVGTGGMAVVYRAQDQVLDRTVAVKIMLPQYAGDATFAARFKQEAQAAAGLSSPYIVGVYDWGRDGDTYYIVMEYLRGTDLKSGIRSHGALDPKKVAQIGSQICGALSVAHKHEIIHRDIKPQNIMVLPDGNIKVMDFGIARAKNSHLTQDNNVLGTAHYVSPEQTRGQELGPTTDIYSLGVVMYECATGRVPFDGDDAISVALKQVNEIPVPPSQVNPRVDADLEGIILKCMEKDPANRFQTADELRQVLNSYLAGRAVEVPEPTHVLPAGAAGVGNATQTIRRPNAAAQQLNQPGSTDPRMMPVDNYAAEKEGTGRGKIAAIVIGVIAVIALAVFLATNVFGSGGSATVPDVVGKTQEEAVSEIQAAGFEMGTISQSYSNDVEKGKVIEQTPDGNKEASKDTKVYLVISKGKKPVDKVTVPDLTGKSKAQAESALSQLGLTAKVTEEANDAEKGTVFWQSVDAGEQVEAGSTVEVKVSSGPTEVSVPGVLGMSEAKASNTLSSAGFSVQTAEDYSDQYDEGTVMKQSVTGSAPKGTTITITISKGSNKATVPSLSGMTKAEAESALTNAGFTPSFKYTSSSSVENDYVISWTPTGSTSKGGTVTVTVSTGPSNSGTGTGNGGTGTGTGNGGTGGNFAGADEGGTD